MFNMASIRTVSLCLLLSSLMRDAISAGKFVEIICSESEIEAYFGTSTLLDCVVESKKYSNVKVEAFTWKLNKTPVLNFLDGRDDPKDPRFQLAKSPWEKSNMNVSLLITNTNLSHTGVYHCTVVTSRGDDETEVHLTVKAHYSEPIILSDPEPDKITDDKGFTLTCETHGGFPQGHIRWLVNDDEWKNKPEEKVYNTSDGLYTLTSKLSFGPNSVFTKFVCEVYNASKVIEVQRKFDKPLSGHSKGSDPKGQSVSHIVAPVVVIGSLIVGLLLAVLVMCRRKHQNVPMAECPEENTQMV